MVDKSTEKHWYALKVFYNKVFDIQDILKSEDIETYIPVETVTVEKEGVRREVQKTIIPSLMFFRSTEHYAMELQERLTNRVILYTNKKVRYTEEKIELYEKRPAAISNKEMEIFILVTSAGEGNIEIFPDDYMKYKTGQKVRVTGGIFKGAEGYVKRIKHDRRFTVTIKGICMVATPRILPCFLEAID